VNTTQLEYWRVGSRWLWKDQHPGCHTGASGFDYVPWETELDEHIDEVWRREEKAARQRLVQLLRNRKATNEINKDDQARGTQ
jgi:hypothetical protein